METVTFKVEEINEMITLLRRDGINSKNTVATRLKEATEPKENTGFLTPGEFKKYQYLLEKHHVEHSNYPGEQLKWLLYKLNDKKIIEPMRRRLIDWYDTEFFTP